MVQSHAINGATIPDSCKGKGNMMCYFGLSTLDQGHFVIPDTYSMYVEGSLARGTASIKPKN